MHMLVTPMRRHGVALSPQERRRYQAIRGNVMVSSVNSNELGRSANVARIDVGMPLDPDPLPRLLDATLAGMAVTGFVLSGIEYIDGCAYAQSWWCRQE
ncbi:hypothetical protein C5612_00660 [Pseudomonas frederiksbergensis]|uniref:Uncharacterized protein n=1 Tax=Pseudomonas frederiksbergensis TaxID=104087 RepID=A0A2S8HV39_9PSED|nr:hypothetical protein [Pseudomonas frederiksbergensis]PQP06309.1 hypothetical protein C5612_00660 [Pseudomonas frederiksbergensis]